MKKGGGQKNPVKAKSVHGFFKGDLPLAIGHRGAAALAPENTLEAFRAGLAAGADILECDLRLTKDGEVIVLHDASLNRTTDGKGKVSKLTLAEVRAHDAGYRFTRDKGKTFPFRGKGVQIPTLRELLDTFPQARFYLEIKGVNKELIRKVFEIVEEKGRGDAVVIMSNCPKSAHEIHKCAAKMKSKAALVASFTEVSKAIVGKRLRRGPGKSYEAFSIPPRWPHGKRISLPVLTKAFNTHVSRHGKHVIAWTINKEKDMEKLIDMGVDAIVSDDPGRLKNVIRRKRAP